MLTNTNTTESLWDWRRQVADLYSGVRAARDPESAWTHWRARRDALFAHHPQTPLDQVAGFTGIPCYPYNSALRFAVSLNPIPDAASEPYAAGADGEVMLRPFARTHGLRTALGGELTLYWITGYGGGVFLPFADATNGSETYGAGRYLLDSIKSADLGTTRTGETILDFNFAYFPSCAYSPRWTCPLPPPANRLAVAVRGGERLK
jgi:uncharacterized protein (DUF1684 family)